MDDDAISSLNSDFSVIFELAGRHFGLPKASCTSNIAPRDTINGWAQSITCDSGDELLYTSCDAVAASSVTLARLLQPPADVWQVKLREGELPRLDAGVADRVQARKLEQRATGEVVIGIKVIAVLGNHLREHNCGAIRTWGHHLDAQVVERQWIGVDNASLVAAATYGQLRWVVSSDDSDLYLFGPNSRHVAACDLGQQRTHHGAGVRGEAILEA
eukprot:1626059-Prymnesium_polylepis.1